MSVSVQTVAKLHHDLVTKITQFHDSLLGRIRTHDAELEHLRREVQKLRFPSSEGPEVREPLLVPPRPACVRELGIGQDPS